MIKRDRKRLLKIIEEFMDGFDCLKDVKKGVVVFGSARTSPKNEYYKKAYELSYKLVKKNYTVITGAGKGIMEACNKGAIDGGGNSVGLNISLPEFQDKNDYINKYIKFEHFYVRKVMFAKYSFATLVFPGGYGTADELFEQLTLLQNKKIPKRPLIIIGKKYYSPLLKWIKKTLYNKKNISKKDLNLIETTDNVNKALDMIVKYYKRRTKKFFI